MSTVFEGVAEQSHRNAELNRNLRKVYKVFFPLCPSVYNTYLGAAPFLRLDGRGEGL